jgi:hypothetical protein
VLHKKNAGSDSDPTNFRLCIDYRALNKKTKVIPHSMHRIDFILAQLGKAKVFTMIDLSMGYHNIFMDPQSKSRTAFKTPHRGAFQYNMMPFGLAAASFTFQRVIDEVLRGILYKFCLAFIDDIVVYSDSWEEHLVQLHEVFTRLADAGFTINPDKLQLGQDKIDILGHVVADGISTPDPEKVSSNRICGSL